MNKANTSKPTMKRLGAQNAPDMSVLPNPTSDMPNTVKQGKIAPIGKKPPSVVPKFGVKTNGKGKRMGKTPKVGKKPKVGYNG